MAEPIAARIAAAQAMTKGQAPPAKTPAAAPAAITTPEASADADTTTETPAAAEADGAGDGDTASTDEASTETLSEAERLEAAGTALEKGDLKALAKALGKDIKVPDSSLKAFRSISRREQKLAEKASKHETKVGADNEAIDKAKREIAEDSAKNSRLLRHVESKYGWIPNAEKAWDEGDMVTVGKALERLCKGASIATITQRLAGVKTGDGVPAPKQTAASDPEKDQLKARLAELERKDTDREKANSERSTAERRDKGKADFGKALAKHPFLANPDDPGKVDPDALEEAFKAYEGGWDPKVKKFTKSAKQVVDELHAREMRKLKRLGLSPATSAAPPPAPKPKTAPTTRRIAEPPKTVPAGGAQSPEATRAARVAMARRMTEQQTRGLR